MAVATDIHDDRRSRCALISKRAHGTTGALVRNKAVWLTAALPVQTLPGWVPEHAANIVAATKPKIARYKERSIVDLLSHYRISPGRLRGRPGQPSGRDFRPECRALSIPVGATTSGLILLGFFEVGRSIGPHLARAPDSAPTARRFSAR